MWVSKDYDLELSQGPGDLSLSRNTPKDFRYDQTVRIEMHTHAFSSRPPLIGYTRIHMYVRTCVIAVACLCVL